MLSPKAKQIILFLLQEKDTVTAQDIANQMNVSKRTIQREMETIEPFLEGKEVTLVKKMGTGIWLEGSVECKNQLRSDLLEDELYDAGNKEERQNRLILEILKTKELAKLSYYSYKFQISESTVSKDLDVVKDWFKQFDIELDKKAGIKGSETDFRRAIRSFVEENMDTDFMNEIYENEDVVNITAGSKYGNLKNIFDDTLLKKVISSVFNTQEDLFENLTESALTGLIIHLTIAIERIQKNEIIENPMDYDETIQKDDEYALALKLVDNLSKDFEIEIPKVETFYIYLHLKGAKHEKIEWNGQGNNKFDNQKIVKIVNEMIDVFDSKNAWIYKQDNEFLQGLLAHLQPTIIRLMYRMKINNPVLDQIKHEYADVYEQCILVSKVLENHLDVKVPDEEIGFLAIHFGAAKVRLESQKEKIRKVQIGVVCASGIGMSRLMSTKLKQIFRDRVDVKVYGKRDVDEFVVQKNDFFVSSIQLEITDVPVVYVDLFMNDTNIEEIQKLVYHFERCDNHQSNKDDFTMQLEKINVLTTQINAVIQSFHLYKVNEDISFNDLLDLIGRSLSRTKELGDMIIQDLKNREAISSQVLAEFGFALLHARTKGVVEPVVTIYVPASKDIFTNAYFKKIHVVFVILIPDDENLEINGELLGYISSAIIEDPLFLEIASNKNQEEVRDYISIKMKEFLQENLQLNKAP